eukprot:scaffold104321_cov63-Phaeocystis_antarctica.AAC.1
MTPSASSSQACVYKAVRSGSTWTWTAAPCLLGRRWSNCGLDAHAAYHTIYIIRDLYATAKTSSLSHRCAVGHFTLHLRRRLYPPVVRRVLVDRGHEVAVQRVAEAPLVLLGRYDGAALDARLRLLLPRVLPAVVDDADDQRPLVLALGDLLRGRVRVR